MTTLRMMRKKLDPRILDTEVVAITDKIVKASNPLAIYLFGSAAEGKATDHSDLDFLIVVSGEEELKTSQKKVSKQKPLSTFPLDLVWVTEEEFNRKKELGGVCLVVWEDGKLVYVNPQAKGFHNDKNQKI